MDPINAIFRLACQLAAGCTVQLPECDGLVLVGCPANAGYQVSLGTDSLIARDVYAAASWIASLADPTALADWLTEHAA